MSSLHDDRSRLTEPTFLTVGEAARLIRRSKSTLQHWIYGGKLGAAQGLRYCAGRPLIDRAVFLAALVTKPEDS